MLGLPQPTTSTRPVSSVAGSPAADLARCPAELRASSYVSAGTTAVDARDVHQVTPPASSHSRARTRQRKYNLRVADRQGEIGGTILTEQL